MTTRRLLLSLVSVTPAVVVAMVATASAQLRHQSGEAHIEARITGNDHAAALSTTNHFCHILPVRRGHGAQPAPLPDCQRHTSASGAEPGKSAPPNASGPGLPFFSP